MPNARLAFLAANPRDKQIVLRQPEELQRLKQLLSSSRIARRVEVLESLTTTLDDLNRVIESTQPEILHFSGFEASSRGGILVENAQGYAHPVSTPMLAAALRRAHHRPRLLLFNCCNSDGTAKALSKLAASVIGYKGDVADDLCNAFCAELYRGVFACEPLQSAFEAASETASQHPTAIAANRQHGLLLKPARLFMHSEEQAKDYKVLQLSPVSVFISYGGPDQKIAERIHDALESKGFDAFCFSKDAQPGTPLHQLMFEGVNQADKIVLICSRSSLKRPGVLNEIEETLRKTARAGGKNALIPLTLDDFVFGELPKQRPDLATRLRDLVIADFRDAQKSSGKFQQALDRLIQSLGQV